MSVAIRLEHLCRDFGSTRAVDDVTLSVPHGVIFGLLGPNGAGKTTILRLLLGLLTPSAGWAEVLGYDVRTHAHAIRAACGVLLEHTGLYERLTAWENLEFFGRVARLPQDQRRERIRQLLTRLGLWARREERVATWSRGMRQKLAVARALLHRPRLVFLDEPTAGLDPVAAASLRDDLLELARQEGVTVFLTTHNLAEAEKICDRVAVIQAGRLLAAGTPAELQAQRASTRLLVRGRNLTHPEVQRALATCPDIRAVRATDADGHHLALTLAEEADPAAIVRLLIECGAQVEEARRERSSLEAVFLSLVGEDS